MTHIIGRGRYARATYPTRREGVGGGGFDFPNRVDLSVNSARVESANSVYPMLHTQTGGNTAGGYNGGGLGNKSILGIDVGNGLPLGQLKTVAYTWLNAAPFIASFPVYANLVVDINGDGSVYKIFVIDPSVNPALNVTTNVTNPDGSVTTTFDAATNYVQVVNFIPPVVPAVNLGPSWPSQSFRMSDILAAYPNAVLRRAASGDGGLPNGTVTPAFLLATGDSNNNTIRQFRLSAIKFNGVLV